MRSAARREPCHARSNLVSRTNAHARDRIIRRAAGRTTSAGSRTASRASTNPPCATFPNSPSGPMLRYSGSMQPCRLRGELPHKKMPSLEPSPSHREPYLCPPPCHTYDAHSMQPMKGPPRAHNREHTTETPPASRRPQHNLYTSPLSKTHARTNRSHHTSESVTHARPLQPACATLARIAWHIASTSSHGTP